MFRSSRLPTHGGIARRCARKKCGPAPDQSSKNTLRRFVINTFSRSCRQPAPDRPHAAPLDGETLTQASVTARFSEVFQPHQSFFRAVCQIMLFSAAAFVIAAVFCFFIVVQ